MSKPADPLKKSYMLLEKARAGDRDAGGELFERYLSRIIYLVRSRLEEPLRNRLETMDIVQEVLATAYVRLQEFDPRSSGAFYVWMREIVNRKVRDAYRHHFARKRSLEREVSLQKKEEGSADFQDRIPGVSSLHLGTYLDQQEAVMRLEKELENLQEGQAMALKLWYLEGLTPSEMAGRLDRSPDACRMLVARALKTLGTRFKDLPDPSGT